MREITVDLGAIRANYAAIKAETNAKVMAVIKANAYGHGMIEVARALEQVGVDALGVADLTEAIALREAGIQSRVMCWILDPGANLSIAKELDIELGISTFEQLDTLAPGTKIHVKVDTGLGRNGFSTLDWERLFGLLPKFQPVGIFSHLSNTSVSDDLKQKASFEKAIALAEQSGVTFVERHLAASAATISYPDFHFDMVRVGIALYGLNPFEDSELGLDLKPAMRVSAHLVNVKRVPAGQGVSYGYRYVTERQTTLGVVPFGYGEGMPRISEGYEVSHAGNLYPVVGRVAMDQFVVDFGDAAVAVGDEVVIFGSGLDGELGAQELGASAKSINYEVVTRIGGRATRRYLGQ
jgi:alanine racemase